MMPGAPMTGEGQRAARPQGGPVLRRWRVVCRRVLGGWEAGMGPETARWRLHWLRSYQSRLRQWVQWWGMPLPLPLLLRRCRGWPP